MSRRPIRAIASNLVDLVPGDPATGRPELTWVKPTDLVIDEVYQRDLSERSLKLIRRIVEGFDWRRFKPPICAWADEGLEVIDGQHSAIAAATHPLIDEIPVIVVQATARADRASAFIGHNRDRLAVSSAQMHAAAAAAGDERARAINAICEDADVRVLRTPPASGAYKARELIAVSAVDALLKRYGANVTRDALRILADAECAPIQAVQLQAVAHLLTNEDFVGLDPSALTGVIQDIGPKQAEKEAKEHRATHGVTLWRGLAAVWFKAAKKRRRANAPGADARQIQTAVDVPSWVPEEFREDYVVIARRDGEESAASFVRGLKSGGSHRATRA